jgi:hypothetical protein
MKLIDLKFTLLIQFGYHSLPFLSSRYFMFYFRTLTEAQQYRPSIEEACRHLLNHHISTIQHMLSLKSTAKHRQIVLKLLAGQCFCSNYGIQCGLNCLAANSLLTLVKEFDMKILCDISHQANIILVGVKAKT